MMNVLCIIKVFGREPVYSAWYLRRLLLWKSHHTYIKKEMAPKLFYFIYTLFLENDGAAAEYQSIGNFQLLPQTLSLPSKILSK